MGLKDLPMAWDICLDFLYSMEYVEGLAEFLKQNKVQKVLDCACGTGFPAVHLIPGQDFSLVLSDGNREMADKAREKIGKHRLEAPVFNLKWQELDKKFKEEFDCVICRGNSLVYVDSWGKNTINPEKAKRELEISLKNFYNVLREGGFCYIDLISRKEFENPSGVTCELFGKKKINGSEYSVVWLVKHDKKNKVRAWSPQILEWNNGIVTNKKSFSMKSYLLNHQELEEMLYSAGFSNIRKCVKIKGENHYDVFIAHKTLGG